MKSLLMLFVAGCTTQRVTYRKLHEEIRNMKEHKLYNTILDIARREKRPMDIDYLAGKTGKSWWTVYKVICDQLLCYLQSNHPEVLRELELIPMKTRKSLVLFLPEIYFRKEAS